MLLVPRAKSYGLQETFEILEFPYNSTWNYARPVEGNTVFCRQGTQGRVLGQKKDIIAISLVDSGKPYLSPSYMGV